MFTATSYSLSADNVIYTLLSDMHSELIQIKNDVTDMKKTISSLKSTQSNTKYFEKRETSDPRK